MFRHAYFTALHGERAKSARHSRFEPSVACDKEAAGWDNHLGSQYSGGCGRLCFRWLEVRTLGRWNGSDSGCFYRHYHNVAGSCVSVDSAGCKLIIEGLGVQTLDFSTCPYDMEFFGFSHIHQKYTFAQALAKWPQMERCQNKKDL